MGTQDRLIAIVTAFIWGINFVALRQGLVYLPPFFLAGLRFMLCALPILFVKKPPSLRWKTIFLVGFCLGLMKFTLIYLGLSFGLNSGQTAMILQLQAAFTLGLSALLLGEWPRSKQIIGVGWATLGIMVLVTLGESAISRSGFLCIAGAALGWALANITIKKHQVEDPLALTLWMSMVPIVPLFAISALSEGPENYWLILPSLPWDFWASLGFTAIVSTIGGYSLWAYLVKKYSAARVSPFALLVPVFGMVSGILFKGEKVGPLTLMAAFIIISGVYISQARLGRLRLKFNSKVASDRNAADAHIVR